MKLRFFGGPANGQVLDVRDDVDYYYYDHGYEPDRVCHTYIKEQLCGNMEMFVFMRCRSESMDSILFDIFGPGQVRSKELVDIFGVRPKELANRASAK